MRKTSFLIFFIFLTLLSVKSQTYQRMLIPTNQISNLQVSSFGSTSLNAICLDALKDIPTGEANLNNILSNGDKIVIHYTDQKYPRTDKLSDLLGEPNGISIKGSDENPIRNYLGLNLELILNNYTGRPFKLEFKDNVQVGGRDQKIPAKFYNNNQYKQWEAEIIDKLEKLNYSGKEDFCRRNNISSSQFYNKFKAEYKVYEIEEAVKSKVNYHHFLEQRGYRTLKEYLKDHETSSTDELINIIDNFNVEYEINKRLKALGFTSKNQFKKHYNIPQNDYQAFTRLLDQKYNSFTIAQSVRKDAVLMQKIRDLGYTDIVKYLEEYELSTKDELIESIENNHNLFKVIQFAKENIEFKRKAKALGYDDIDNYIRKYYLTNKTDFKNKLNKDYDEYLFEKEVIEYFANNDIGIKGENAKELIEKYKQAISDDISWSDIKLKIREDYENRRYYLFDKWNTQYIPYVRSIKINGLIFKESDYIRRNFTRLEEALFLKKIDKRNMHILNFLDKSEDKRTYETIIKYFPNNHSDFSLIELVKLKNEIKEKNIKYLFCLGHFEKGKIFTYVNGTKHAYNIDIIYKIADELNIEVFLIGCKSSLASGGRTGTTLNVNSITILEIIYESLQSSNSFGEFLSRFVSRGEQTYNFAFEFEEPTNIVKVHVYEKGDYSNETYNDNTKEVVVSFKMKYIKPYFDDDEE